MFVRLWLECFSSAVLSSGVRHLSFASFVVFDVACSASDLAQVFSPLPQVHLGKWYPPAGTWPAVVVISDEWEQTNGMRMRAEFELVNIGF